MNFLRDYGTIEGPLGLPCTDAQAFALDALLHQLSTEDRELKKAALPAALTTLEFGERADVSWISTEAPDRYGDIVLAKGLAPVSNGSVSSASYDLTSSSMADPTTAVPPAPAVEQILIIVAEPAAKPPPRAVFETQSVTIAVPLQARVPVVLKSMVEASSIPRTAPGAINPFR